MAARGRGSAVAGGKVAVVVGVLLLCVLVAESAVFNVGDRSGWSFNTNSWPNGKRFKAGDVLGTSVYYTYVHACKIDTKF
jgi:hypothetical protein